MKIALLTDGITPYVVGGMQKHSYNLAKYLTIAGHDVALVHCVPYGEVLPTKKEVNDILFTDSNNKLFEQIILHFPKNGLFPGHYIRNSYIYSELIYERLQDNIENFDFIYAKGFTAWKILEEKQKGIKIPPVGVKFHGYEMWQPIPGVTNKLKQLLLRKSVQRNNINADIVFSYGGKITDLIKSIGVEPKKIIELPTGIGEDWIKKTELTVNPVLHFLFVGRYERRKGIEEINMVIKELSKEDIEVEFHFIGPVFKEKQLTLTNSKTKTTYYGKIMNSIRIQEIMDSCDILLCPSYSEGMPNVILEAMSRGLAIIATDVGAVNQMVSNQNGWLIKGGNLLALKNAIFKAIADTTLMEKKINSVQKVKNQFLWSLIAGKIIKEINSTISKNKSNVI